MLLKGAGKPRAPKKSGAQTFVAPFGSSAVCVFFLCRSYLKAQDLPLPELNLYWYLNRNRGPLPSPRPPKYYHPTLILGTPKQQHVLTANSQAPQSETSEPFVVIIDLGVACRDFLVFCVFVVSLC